MWIGTKDIWCFNDNIESAMWFGLDVTGSFHYQYEVLYGLGQMIKYNVTT
jgi:hypothetical protein